ncbi:GIY-YIG nuclease family protein [Ruegeria atlantica]|uniref:GIY-YIG nuclease family protein n=1 Tax=Ruegeria atlantica TaxID=81569 RepID=UPI00148096CC|nr:GIY-YIG nuclease family protein [Ruegeria atlantica]
MRHIPLPALQVCLAARAGVWPEVGQTRARPARVGSELFGAVLCLAIAILFLAWRIIPWLRRRGRGWGTVYLMQSRRHSGLFKVGYTTRRTKDRRTELNRVGGDDMKIVFTVSMPRARQCERIMLHRLRHNPARKRDRRGTEWFWLRHGERIEDIATALLATAHIIKRVSRLKLSWPAGGEIRTFSASGRDRGDGS